MSGIVPKGPSEQLEEHKDEPNRKYPAGGTMKSPPVPPLPRAPLKSKLNLGVGEREPVVTLFVGTENEKWSVPHVPEAPVTPQDPKLNKGRGERILVSALIVVAVSKVTMLSRLSGIAVVVSTVSKVPRLSKLSVDSVRLQETPRKEASSEESELYGVAWLRPSLNQSSVNESRPSYLKQKNSRRAPHKDRMMRCVTTLTRMSESSR